MLMFVKVCGVTRVEDVEACVAAGVDAIGFNLWPRSKRFVDRQKAGELARAVPAGIARVVLFVDAPIDEVASVVESGRFDVAQLHGDETSGYVAELAARLGRARVWKALRLRDARSLDGIEAWAADRVLVDADAPGMGGSGLPADRALAVEAARRRPVVLAGGLTPATVADAIRAVRPAGVDVASGVERAPGIKDPDAIAAFVRAARNID
jgi:phosphoribosylanthranilate isomerase